jgi:23S rRNA (pseudouridine1915-N3)-methyltransferase
VRLTILAAGTRLPRWVDEGYADYAGRFGHDCRLELHEIELGRRGKGLPTEAAIRDEGRRMLALLDPGDFVVALEVSGKRQTTELLAAWFDRRRADGRDLVFLIGGPDGLAPECLARANERLSLSDLTLPHGLARVLLVEQLYRVLSLSRGHPYHRA